MDTSLRPMTEAEYTAWCDEMIPAYAADKVASGQWPAAEALLRSQQEHQALLPQGRETPDHHLFTLVDSLGTMVGRLWFAVTTKFERRVAYVYDIEILPLHRRAGHARRAFVALEDEVRRLGLSGIALHVFGHNTGARSLYDALGYQPTNISLFKPLGPAAGLSPADSLTPPPAP